MCDAVGMQCHFPSKFATYCLSLGEAWCIYIYKYVHESNRYQKTLLAARVAFSRALDMQPNKAFQEFANLERDCTYMYVRVFLKSDGSE